MRILSWLSVGVLIASMAGSGWGQRHETEAAAELIRRMDVNRNGVLEAQEISPRARAGVVRLATEAGLDVNKPLRIDQLQRQLASQRQRDETRESDGPRGRRGTRDRRDRERPDRESSRGRARDEHSRDEHSRDKSSRDKSSRDKSSRDTRSRESKQRDGSSTVASSPTREFGVATGESKSKGFGASGNSRGSERSSRDHRPSERSSRDRSAGRERASGHRGSRPDNRSDEEGDRTRRYSKGLLKKHDRNDNGVLEEEEWRQMRKRYAAADTNKDSVITANELAVFFSNPSRESSNSRSGTKSSSRSGRDRRDTTSNRRAGRNSRRRDANRDERKSYRFLAPAERIPKILSGRDRDWFLEKDRDGDGQIAMSEFTDSWSKEKVDEFGVLDLNADGVVTPREYDQSSSD